MRSEREKGGNPAPGDSKGRSPWRAFGDFPHDGKVTRGGGVERPPLGVEGAVPPRIGHPGWRVERPPHWGCRGSVPYSPSLQKIYLTWTPLQVVSYF